MSYVLSTKHARRSDPDFVVAAARAFYCDWYLSDEARERRVSGAGVELTEVIPETQRWAFKLARRFVERLEAAAGHSLPHILTDFEASWSGDLDYSEENAGWYAAMEAMGHGVGLYLFSIDFDPMPRVEAYPGAEG